MKLPYIKIEYREEETYALGKVSVSLIVGFALYWALLYATLFNGSTFFFPQTPDVAVTLFPTAVAAFVVVLLAYGMFLEQMRQLFSTRHKRNRNRMVAAACLFAGMVISLAAGLFPVGYLGFGFVAGILQGVGSAVLLMSFGISFSVCDLPTIALCTAISIPAAAILLVTMVLLNSLSHPMGILACLVCPFLQLACLSKCSANLVDKLEFRALTIPVRTAPFALHVFLPGLVFGVALGLVRSYTVALPADFGTLETVWFVVVLASLFVFGAIMFAMFTQRQSNNFAFRTLVPVAAVLMGILVIPQVLASYISVFALFGTYLIIEASMWIMHADISQRFRISAFTVFGFGRAALAIGAFVGYEFALAAGPFDTVLPGTAPFLAIMLIAFTFGVALLPTNQELRRVLKVGQHCPALVHEEDYALDALDAASTLSEQEIEDTAATEAGGAQLKEPRDVVQTSDVSQLAAVYATDEQPTEAEAQRKAGWFKRKCSVIADRYLLSRRETEVLFLLAKGRSSTTIQENLFISEGTANTHMRHIYRKLDVHSQRELMDLVEGVELDD